MSVAVTWLLPVKNGMPYLPATLASIEAQTCKNFEILAWDNGSTDETVEELRRWIPGRIPGKIIADRPLELGDCRAQMVLAANTELCAWIDADDVNEPTRLEEQLTFLWRNPRIAIVGSQVTRIDSAGVGHGQHYTLPLHHDDIVHRMLHSFSMWQPTVLFRREAVISAGNYRHWNPFIEDYDLWMRLACGHQLANLDRCLLKYRVHQNGTTSVAKAAGTLGDALQKCFGENAPMLFGCSAEEARSLRDKANASKLPILIKIARHLCATQGGRVLQRFSSDSWIEAMRTLRNRRDVATRSCLLGLKILQIRRSYIE